MFKKDSSIVEILALKKGVWSWKQMRISNPRGIVFLNRNNLDFGALIEVDFSQPHSYIKHHDAATTEGYCYFMKILKLLLVNYNHSIISFKEFKLLN